MKQIFSALGLALLIGNSALAQNDSLIDHYIESVKPSGIVYFKPQTLDPGDLFTTYKSFFLSNDDHEMTLVKQWTDTRMGINHDKYQLSYKGYKVEACEFIEHYYPNDYVLYANGKVTELDETIVEGSIMPENIALQNLIASLEGEVNYTFAWDDTDMEQMIQDDLADPNATFYPTGELIWALDNSKDLGFEIDPNRYSLAWKFEILCVDPDFHRTYFVDAFSSQILKFYEEHHTDGPANTHIYGWETIDTKSRGWPYNDFVLQAGNNGRDFETKYSGSSNSWNLTSRIDDDDDNWGSDRDATSIHYNVQESWDYFDDVHGLEGMDDNSAELRIYAHSPYGGPFYTKSGKKHYLYIGDVNSSDLGRCLDVIAHEFTHGVTTESADLIYRFEQGALNESYSDIFGAVVEAHVEGSISDWLTAEDGITDSMINRSLEDPNSFGYHANTGCTSNIIGQPDTYEGDFWWSGGIGCDNGGVHINSGVQNYWFYLLVTGGIGTNDNSESFSVTGIGMDDAADIAFWTLTNQLTSFSEYEDARDLSIESAIRIFGECSNEREQTQNAWHAVGIGDRFVCPPLSITSYDKLDVSIFPNPTNGEFTIYIGSEKESTLNVFSIDGQLLQRSNVQGQVQSLNLNEHPKGVYLIKVESGDQVSYQKIIVQ